MLRGAGETFSLVKSSGVLVRSCFRYSLNSNSYVFNSVQILNKNGRFYSFALRRRQDLKPKHVRLLLVDADKQARIIALKKRIRFFEALIYNRQKACLTEKSKIVLEKLLLVLKDMEKALRELRQLL